MLPENRLFELMILAALALIVVGPKDLPVLLRRLGQWVGKLRSMANEFRSSFDEMARQSELDDLRREVEAMKAANQHGAVEQAFAEIDRGISPTVNYAYDHDISGLVPAEPAPQMAVLEPVAPEPKPVRKRAPRKAAAAPVGEEPASATKPRRRKAASASGADS